MARVAMERGCGLGGWVRVLLVQCIGPNVCSRALLVAVLFFTALGYGVKFPCQVMAMDLQEAQNLARTYSPELSAMASEYAQLGLHRYRPLFSLLPSITLECFEQDRNSSLLGNTSTMGIKGTLSQPLWDGGRVKWALRLSEAERALSRLNLMEKERELDRVVMDAFLAVFAANTVLGNRQRSLEFITSQKVILEAEFSVGLVLDSELRRAELKLRAARLAEAAAGADIQAAMEHLAVLVGLPLAEAEGLLSSLRMGDDFWGGGQHLWGGGALGGDLGDVQGGEPLRALRGEPLSPLRDEDLFAASRIHAPFIIRRELEAELRQAASGSEEASRAPKLSLLFSIRLEDYRWPASRASYSIGLNLESFDGPFSASTTLAGGHSWPDASVVDFSTELSSGNLLSTRTRSRSVQTIEDIYRMRKEADDEQSLKRTVNAALRQYHLHAQRCELFELECDLLQDDLDTALLQLECGELRRVDVMEIRMQLSDREDSLAKERLAAVRLQYTLEELAGLKPGGIAEFAREEIDELNKADELGS
jgi:outer membrane protein TolC